jgi:23S rRNA (uracil1939-C5)-methyltransferase
VAPHFDVNKLEFVSSPKAFHYRHRTRLQFHQGRPAYFKARSRDLLVLEECPILTEKLWTLAQSRAAELQNAQDRSLSVSDFEGLEYEVNGRRLQYDETCFTQGNLFQNENLTRLVSEEIEKIKTPQLAWDLYAGIGNFTALMLDRFSQITAVESHSKAADYGKKNIPEAKWIHKSVAQALESELSEDSPQFVLLDPARDGALQEMRTLSKLRSCQMVYVSCQLDSLIRDLTALLKIAPWKIERWCVVDLFPQTRHIESLVSLKARTD